MALGLCLETTGPQGCQSRGVKGTQTGLFKGDEERGVWMGGGGHGSCEDEGAEEGTGRGLLGGEEGGHVWDTPREQGVGLRDWRWGGPHGTNWTVGEEEV